jgi:Tol biopolymer transport system component
LDARELEDTDGARQPFWSPDSRSIGFFAGGDLRRVDVSGGTVSTLAPAPEPRGGAWTTDDTIVFSATSAGALQRVSASTGGTRFQLTWFSPEGVVLNTVGTVDRYASLRLSPDGKEALIVIDDASRKRDLWRFDLTGGTRSRVTSGGCGSFAVWSPDGQQIVYSSLLGKELEATSARGAVQVENLWNADTVVYPADVSRDGGRLAYVATHPETGFDIWQLEMKGSRQRIPLLRSPFSEYHPQFSPDVQWLVYTTTEGGLEEVYVQAFPDAGRRQLPAMGPGRPRDSLSGRRWPSDEAPRPASRRRARSRSAVGCDAAA